MAVKIQVVEGGRERQTRTRVCYFCKSGDGRGDVAMGTRSMLADGFLFESNSCGVKAPNIVEEVWMKKNDN